MNNLKLFSGSVHHLAGLENDVNIWFLTESSAGKGGEIEMMGMAMTAAANGELFVAISYGRKKDKAKE